MDSLPVRRRATVVPVSGGWLRAARGDPVRRRGLCLPALLYESQRERDYDRLAGRADKIRRRLGWPVGILNPTPWTKPKGMRWLTFWRLTAEHNRLVGASLEGMSEHLGTVRRGLGRHAGGPR